VDFDTTENLYIEGDNLDVLKLLRETYLNRVKMIYIDPPYNTGHDFVYEDDFADETDSFLRRDGQFDEQGNRLTPNLDSNGRFHTDWLNMIYPRLRIARDLLTEDGVIFISIDDNEVENLKKLCGEIFGSSNFVAIVNWKGRGGRQDSRYYAAVHEYILVYAKNISNFQAGEEVKSGDVYPKYDEEKKRYYKTQLLRKWGSNSRREDRPNLYYPITAPDGSDVYPMLSGEAGSTHNLENCGCWRHGASTMRKNIEEGRVEFVKQSNGSWIAYEKIFAPLEGEEATKKYTTWVEETNDGANVVKSLFSSAVFDYPKTPQLIGRFLKMAGVEDGDIVLDFFSGSATTAHAVMQLNAEDGASVSSLWCSCRKFAPRGRRRQRRGTRRFAKLARSASAARE
jgi:adenine-specific DNA-methyltransferase